MTEHEIPFNYKYITIKSHHEKAPFQPLTIINCLKCRDPVDWTTNPGDWATQKHYIQSTELVVQSTESDRNSQALLGSTSSRLDQAETPNYIIQSTGH